MANQKSRKRIKSTEQWEDRIKLELRLNKITQYETQYKFHPTRRWKFDFAWPDKMIAIEVEGNTFGRICKKKVYGKVCNQRLAGGRHTQGTGFEKDCEKYNTAALMGWKVYRIPSSMIKGGKSFELINEIFGDNNAADRVRGKTSACI